MLIWNRNAVVSDLIGSESAIIKLVNEVGSIDDEDDFKENIDYIHTYFRKGEIPPEFQERLHAPDGDETAVPPSSSSKRRSISRGSRVIIHTCRL